MATKKKAPARPARAAGQKKQQSVETPVFRPIALYEFSAGGIEGQARLQDPGRGIALTGGSHGKALPARASETLSLRHYLCRARGGLLAPREEAPCEGKLEGNVLVFRYQQTRTWPVAAEARYTLLSQGGVEVAFTFTPTKALAGFEAGVETVFADALPAVHVHCGGSWVRVAAGHGIRCYPRDLGAAELVADGRWDALRSAGVSVNVEPQGYDYPIAVVREEATGWALVQMALTEECTSLWVNAAEGSVGLCLVGDDLKAAEAATCRARLALCRAERLDEALVPYREFVQEARAGRR